MAATYTTAAQRDAQQTQFRERGVDPFDLLLVATSAVVALAILLAYAGRVTLFEMSESARRDAAVVDLNLVADPGPLEGAMATVFTDPNDRRVAAGEVFRFLADEQIG